MEKNNNGNTNEVLEQVKLELESEKFKNSYSEELLEKAMNDNAEWELKVAKLEKELANKATHPIATTNDSAELANAKNKIASLEMQLSATANTESTSEETIQLKNKVNELMLANQQLREETVKSQQGIGEVMLVAKQQAAQMISDAEKEIKVNVEKARQEFFDIGNKANTITDEIKQSQDAVNTVYKELLERVSKMSAIDFDI